MTSPFIGIDVPSFHPGDPAEWQFWGSHSSALLAPLLTNAGLAKNRRQQRFDYNVAESGWAWEPGGSALLAPLLTNTGLAKSRRPPRFDYNAAESYWSPTLPDSAILQFLTQQKIYGQGGQVPTKQWHYDYDDKSTWLFSPSGFGNSIRNSFANPFFSKAWHYDFNDASTWNWGPQSSDVINILTAGGKPFSKQWRYDYNEASNWTWKAPPSSTLVPILTAGGQPPTKAWRYDYDAASGWTWQYPRDFSLLQPVNPFFSQAWHYDNNDPSIWNWSQVQSRNFVITFTSAVFTPVVWRYNLNDASTWNWSPQGSNVINILTGGGQPFNKQWRYDYNESSNWLFSPSGFADSIRTSFATPFSKFWRYDYNEASLWYSSPIRTSSSINQVTYGSPYRSKAWHYDFYDSSAWRWSPPFGIVINPPAPPVTASGPAWRRWIAQQCGDVILNRVPDGVLVRDIVAHMLDEARCLYPDIPPNNDVLLNLLPKVTLPSDEENNYIIQKMVEALDPNENLMVLVPRDEDDSDEELEAILMASIH